MKIHIFAMKVLKNIENSKIVINLSEGRDEESAEKLENLVSLSPLSLTLLTLNAYNSVAKLAIENFPTTKMFGIS